MPPQQPIPPAQAPQAPASYDFTQAQPPAAPPAPVAPTPPAADPALTQLQSDIAEIKSVLSGGQPAAAPVEPPAAAAPAKQYDEWGAVFEDVDKRAQAIVDQRFAEREQQQQQFNSQTQQQEQQNQQYIDNTVNQLRTAGYLPPVTNQFDANDPGKQAENELLGYTLALGSTDLISAAQELKFRHDSGFRYDYQSKQFVQVNQPNANDPNAVMFGNLPQSADGQPVPNQVMPPAPSAPVGPQNPYRMAQYPPGFNAPVSSGNAYQGTQGTTPMLRNLRSNSYDALVEQFNRTQ